MWLSVRVDVSPVMVRELKKKARIKHSKEKGLQSGRKTGERYAATYNMLLYSIFHQLEHDITSCSLYL